MRFINTRDLETKRFCSHECHRIASIGRPSPRAHLIHEERICSECGEVYIAVVNKQRFCSAKCQGRDAERRYSIKHESLHQHIRVLLRYKGREGLTSDFIMALYEKQNGLCALSGIPLTWDAKKGRVLTNLSIDRIDSSKGYDADNVQLVCRIVNIMKNNLSQDSFIVWCSKIAEKSMPSVSRRQHRLFEAALHDRKVREETGIPLDVADEYVNADKRDHNYKKRERAKKAADYCLSPEIESLLRPLMK